MAIESAGARSRRRSVYPAWPCQRLPKAPQIVAAVGVVDGAWAVIEANAAWTSGRYTADADRALEVVLRAATPVKRVAARDRCFVRPWMPGG